MTLLRFHARALIKSGHMRETPSTLGYPSRYQSRGADNPQGRPISEEVGPLRDFPPIPAASGEDKVRPSRRREEVTRNRDPPESLVNQVTRSNRSERNTLSLNWRLA